MNNTVEEDIYNALNELIGSQFTEFKWRLNLINYDGRPNIPKASLEEAVPEKVVDLLIQHYREDALEVCIHVLKKCNRNDLVENLEKTGQKDVDAHQLPDLSDYRNHIKKKFETMKDPNAVPGEYVLLNERYSKLMILDYHLSKEEREDEILAIGRKHREIISKRAESSTSIETLFNPDKHGLIPQVVVLQGAAGIGKTIMAKKIMFDWASQQLYQDKFNYVFYICCRKMNLHAETEMHSIAEIISEGWLKCHELKKVIPNILKNEGNLLFIIDGFDELYSFDQSKDSFCSDPWKKEPVRILLSSLFQKKLLPKSSLIITTRPTALEKLHQCLEHPAYFEILGFSTKEREEYFYKFFGNEDQATQALGFVQQNDTLFTMCVIPLVSWIICTVIKQEMERGKDLQKTPYTLTAIYMLYLSSLFKFHHKEPKQDIQSNVKGFCSLAAEGILKEKILFMEEEVKKHILGQKNSLPLFLNESIFKEDIDCIQTYSFIHLSFQEFFAALFYVLEEGDEQHSQNLNENLQTLLERHKSFRTDFAVGFRFLFGFLNEGEKMRELKKKFGWEISPKNKEFVLDWVKDNFKNIRYFEFQKEMFCYLYETQDDNFIKNALYGVTEINELCNSYMELMIFSYCLQYCQNLKKLFVECSYFLYHMKTESFLPENKDKSLHERYMEDMFKALTKLRNLSFLSLGRLSFTESCNRHLAEVFKNNQRLKILVLDFEDIDYRTAELLCEGLQDPDCKIEQLELSGKILTESCSRHVVQVFRKNQRLRKLCLDLWYMDEKTMELLCDGLKHPQCTIETLELSGMIMTVTCGKHAAEVFRKNHRLRELCLNIWNPDEKTMELLCDGLKHPQCTIETLELSGKIRTETNWKHAVEVFRKNQRLRKLHLNIQDQDEDTMELLCDGLKHPQCTIETLELSGKILTESCSKHAAEVFRKNHRLRKLRLDIEAEDDKIMELLCDGLKYPQCTIGTLELSGRILTKSYSRHVAEVFRKNQRLRELRLDIQNQHEDTMELLCDGLKHPQCTIETLELAGEVSTISCSRPLAELLRKSQRLRELKLSFESHDGKTMELLCDGLNNPGCTVKKLKLDGEILSEFCSRYLAEVFKKNQRLRELELSFSSPDDKTVELLCGGLNDPECKIKKLKFSGEIPNESCSRHLAELFRGNQRLRQLELIIKYSDEKTVGTLYEVLKHPKCKIETAQLNGKYIIQNGKWMDMERTAKAPSSCLLV